MARHREPDFRLALWGENGVGKSAMMFRMMEDVWQGEYVRDSCHRHTQHISSFFEPWVPPIA